MGRPRSGNQAGDAGVTPNRGATTGHEAKLWPMADGLGGSIDAAEYTRVVLGLILLTHIFDAFKARREAVLAQRAEDAVEHRDEYTTDNVFWVPTEARSTHLRAQVSQPTVGLTIDQATAAIEHDNPTLQDVLRRDYGWPAVAHRLMANAPCSLCMMALPGCRVGLTGPASCTATS